MRKRLKKKKRKMFLKSLPTGDPGFKWFSRALCEVVAAKLGVSVERLIALPPKQRQRSPKDLPDVVVVGRDG